MTFFDIFPKAMKKLRINPAETASIVREMVILAPERRIGIQEIICSNLDTIPALL